MIESLVSLPLLAKAAPLLIPVAATLAKHCLGEDKSLFNELLETLIDHAKDATTDKLEKALKQKPDAALALNQQVFMRYTGWVLGALIRQFAGKPQFEDCNADLEKFAERAPDGWITFVQRGSPGLTPVQQDVFLRQMAASMARDGTLPPVDSVPFITFINWHVRLPAAMQQKLDAYLKQHLDNALHVLLLDENKEAQKAYKQILLSGIHGIRASLQSLHQKMDVTVPLIVETHHTVKAAQQENNLVLGQLLNAVTSNNAEARLAAYKRALLSAFKPYQELAIDNFAAAEQAAPDIWDIFVHPACSAEHLRSEDMDAAQRETPPHLPAQDLLPLLAQDDHRRTVLLADPGMGKSTLIQSLIAHLASGRPLSVAPALTGLLPVPLILRDLVPLLPQDQVESWSWDSLLTVLIETYQRDETALPLCDAFKDHRDEFRQLLHSDANVFFLIDGLDEIGDLAKRRQIVACIQDGIRSVDKEARWLITSRVIGYEDAPVDFVTDKIKVHLEGEYVGAADVRRMEEIYKLLRTKLRLKWGKVELIGLRVNHGKVGFIAEGGDTQLTFTSTSAANVGWHQNEKSAKASVWASIPIAQRIHLAPFDDQRQDLFTQRWFQHRHSTDYSKELMREVRAHHHDGVRIISRVPNLLCMMNILKRSGKPLPDGRAALYDAIVQAYLGGIDSAYRLKPILGNTCPLDATDRRHLLALLAAHMQKVRTASHSQEDAGSIIIVLFELELVLIPAIEIMQSKGQVKSTHSAKEVLHELLKHIASRSGLLIPRGTDSHEREVYGFTHLSFLEFFAAEWLGMEFDRQRNRLSRESEARLDGQSITEADLDSEFPPLGPIQHTRESFKDLPALPAWHEPLVFFLENRNAETPTHQRWLFPALHSSKPHIVPEDDPNPTPLLPLDAVQLVVQLAQDPEIPVAAATRESWWQILWAAYLNWSNPPWDIDCKGWPIAPLLLGGKTHRDESLRSLVNRQCVVPQHPLYLVGCDNLTSADLFQISQMRGLQELYLDHCTGLESTEGMEKLKHLRKLSLVGCKGLSNANALNGLSGLDNLEELLLFDCVGLSNTDALNGLNKLKYLNLVGCIGLKDESAFRGISDLQNLRRLWLNACSGMKDTQCLANLRSLQFLNLKYCTGLVGPHAFQSLAALKDLEELDLSGCVGLENTAFICDLKKLHTLWLKGCTGLNGIDSLGGLVGLQSLKVIILDLCTGLSDSDIAGLRRELGEQCFISKR